MRILIVGRGWTGMKMYYEMKFRNMDVDITGHNQVTSFLQEKQYDWIVNCAGVTGTPNVDGCEIKPTLTMDGNATYPVVLYLMAEKHGARFAHFSSGCIYEGQIDSVYAEPNFTGSIYSVSKGVSDAYLKNRSLVFRIRMPFTGIQEPKNYLTKVVNYAKMAKLYDGGENSLSDHDEAVKVACDLIIENVPNGPHNLVNGGSITMKRLVEKLKIKTEWYTKEEFERVTIAKRSNCVIQSSQRMRSLDEALDSAIYKINNG